MREELQAMRERTLWRIGAVCAILGAIISVAAGASFGNLTTGANAKSVLNTIAAYPRWYWPTVHLGFMLGALLWVYAFVALASSFKDSSSWALGLLGAASVIVGASIHIVDSSINGFGLARLANTWATASASEQASLLRTGDTLLLILGGTWWSVISFFHGVPFVLSGLAVALSRRYPTWLGWLGVIGGAGSLIIGVMMFLSVSLVPEWPFIVFALLVSLFMLIMGVLMWRRDVV